MFDKRGYCLSQYTGVKVMYNVSKQSGQNWIMNVGLKLVKKGKNTSLKRILIHQILRLKHFIWGLCSSDFWEP
jgi:hypothetical protein